MRWCDLCKENIRSLKRLLVGKNSHAASEKPDRSQGAKMSVIKLASEISMNLSGFTAVEPASYIKKEVKFFKLLRIIQSKTDGCLNVF